jgi:predicted YcjX-like family ATPase
MENVIKSTLSLSGDAMAVLEKQASPRKRGEFVSKLLIQYGAVDSGVEQIDVEGMKLMIMGLASANKTLEGRVLKLERQLSVLIANR